MFSNLSEISALLSYFIQVNIDACLRIDEVSLANKVRIKIESQKTHQVLQFFTAISEMRLNAYIGLLGPIE